LSSASLASASAIAASSSAHPDPKDAPDTLDASSASGCKRDDCKRDDDACSISLTGGQVSHDGCGSLGPDGGSLCNGAAPGPDCRSSCNCGGTDTGAKLLSWDDAKSWDGSCDDGACDQAQSWWNPAGGGGAAGSTLSWCNDPDGDPGTQSCSDQAGDSETQPNPDDVSDSWEAVSNDGIDSSDDPSFEPSVMRLLCRTTAGAASTTLAMEKIRRIRATVLARRIFVRFCDVN
jgi:hypothetical protein